MRNFNITVNGKQYSVGVEEIGGHAVPVSQSPLQQTAQPIQQTAQAQPAPQAVQQAPAPAVVPAKAGSGTKITSPMPGTILDAKVNVGDTVKRGQVLLILEAMKMENDIVSPIDGTVSSVVAKKGDNVNSGDLLATVE
ncbi:acetyl-CoA carboxylase biotin carboxyl carrier protein subunit [Clostridia bacterium]|nr:acetyl-CoA carboxylase biotin carboxyl carrier protein subunit [Clostridia bacterium]